MFRYNENQYRYEGHRDQKRRRYSRRHKSQGYRDYPLQQHAGVYGSYPEPRVHYTQPVYSIYPPLPQRSAPQQLLTQPNYYMPAQRHSSPYHPAPNPYLPSYQNSQPIFPEPTITLLLNSQEKTQVPLPLPQKIIFTRLPAIPELPKVEEKVVALEKQASVQQEDAQKKNDHLKKEVKDLKKSRMEVTISEKLKKFIETETVEQFELRDLHVNAAAIVPISAASAGGDNDYSQAVILHKINIYLQMVGKKTITEACCHGIVLLWLTMMSWGVEALFFNILKVIGDCPEDQLMSIQNTLLLFLELIEIGQYPRNFSKQTCTQQNVDEIIGDVRELFAKTQDYTKAEMETEISRLASERNMLAISGWWQDEKTKMMKGHSTGVFFRSSAYHCNAYHYDANYKKLGSRIFSSRQALVAELWERIFTNLEVKVTDKAIFSVNATYGAVVPSFGSHLLPTLFGLKKPAENEVSAMEEDYDLPSPVC